MEISAFWRLYHECVMFMARYPSILGIGGRGVVEQVGAEGPGDKGESEFT